jgi:hypothetical protein
MARSEPVQIYITILNGFSKDIVAKTMIRKRENRGKMLYTLDKVRLTDYVELFGYKYKTSCTRKDVLNYLDIKSPNPEPPKVWEDTDKYEGSEDGFVDGELVL